MKGGKKWEKTPCFDGWGFFMHSTEKLEDFASTEG